MIEETDDPQGCANKCYGFTRLFVYSFGECYCEYSVDKNGDCEDEQDVEVKENDQGAVFNLYKLKKPPATNFKIEERKYVLIMYILDPFYQIFSSFSRFGAMNEL